MTFRVARTPWGVARFAYGYLAGLAAGLIAALLAAISYQIIGGLKVCQFDQPGYCAPVLTGLVGGLFLFAALFLMGHVLRLGWQWAGWVTVLTLCLGQILVETSVITVALAAVIIPAAAAALSFERPGRDWPKWLRIVRVSAMGAAMVQFVVWLIVLALTPL